MTPAEAQEGGYIDGVLPFVEAVAKLESELRSPGSSSPGTRSAGQYTQLNHKETQMKLATPAATAILAALSFGLESVSEANGAKLEAAITDIVEPARTQARAEGEKAGEEKGRATAVTAERARVQGILNHAEAKERMDLALSVASETDMTVEQAAKLLAAAPKQAGGGMLAQLMAGVKNPAVGADGGADLSTQPSRLNTSEIYSRFNARPGQ